MIFKSGLLVMEPAINPITLRAETSGEVKIQGKSDLKLGGEFLVVEGLHFTNGASPSQSVIQFYIDDDTLPIAAG